jgi:CDGSH iron-sulfur domain-containing protein 3
MSVPVVAQKGPFGVEVEAGKIYWWCACGKSQRQPFCDGSHKGGPYVPMEFVAQETEIIWFCGCKHTRSAPLCDGAHNHL